MNVPTMPTIHAERRKRRARTYSGPSGHAATMSTSEPNSTERPTIDRTRPSQIGPLETEDADRTELPDESPLESVELSVSVVAAPVPVAAAGAHVEAEGALGIDVAVGREQPPHDAHSPSGTAPVS